MFDENINIVLADHDSSRMQNIMIGMQKNPRITIVGIANNGDSLIERTYSTKADVVLMEFSLVDATAITIAKELREKSPGTVVFAISDVVSAQFIYEAKSAGIAEIFKRSTFSPFSASEEIANYIDKMRKEYEENANKFGTFTIGTGPMGNNVSREYLVQTIKQSVILTYNTKGGVGKSTIAANLATALKRSQFTSGNRIVIVDFDCSGSNLNTLFNIPDDSSRAKNLLSWKEMEENIPVDYVDSLLLDGGNGLKVLPAHPFIGQAQMVDYELSNKILNILKKHFDIIIIDSSPSISPSVDAAIQHATHILLITNKEGQSLKQLSKIVDLFNVDPLTNKNYAYILQKMFVVVNEAQPSGKWDLKPVDISRTIGRPLLREIPYSEYVKESLHGNSGRQAIELNEDSEFAIQIKKLANDICGAYPDTSKLVSNTRVIKPKSKKSFLKRLLEDD